MKTSDNKRQTGSIFLQEGSINSRIPIKYHIVKTFPIFPQEYSNKGYKIRNEDGKWNVILWPSNVSSYKEEVRYLKNAVDSMVEDLDINCGNEGIDKQDMMQKKAELYEIAFEEIIRQVKRDSNERGELLENVTQMTLALLNEIPMTYQKTIREMEASHQNEIQKMKTEIVSLKDEIRIAKDENESQKILLDMQNQWHTDLESQIDIWKTQVRSFNEKLTTELKGQHDLYEEKINDLEIQLSTVTAERDAYKSQIDWEQKTITDKETEVIEVKKELTNMKSLLDEREQILYTTRAHFERQFLFMKEQMGQMMKGGIGSAINESKNNITQMLPPRQGEQVVFLAIEEINKRILDIYTSRIRHDAAYPDGTAPPLYKFVIKYHIATMYGYQPAVNAIWQFILSCERYRHDSLNVGMFMQQIEDQTSALDTIQYLASLVKKDKLCENGIPRLSLARCAELATHIIPNEELDKLNRLLERKIINPKKGFYVEFDSFVQVFLDVLTDVNHAKRQRIMFQFKELSSQGSNVDWPVFVDFTSRFAPEFSIQKIGDMFLDAIQSSLPSNSVTVQAFQLLVDNGVFERLNVMLLEDYDVVNAADVASFVNIRWVSDFSSHVNKALNEMRTEKMIEFHEIFMKLSRISEHMKTPCVVSDAGKGLVLLHMAGLLLLRFKFLQSARRDSEEAQKSIRKIVDMIWS